MHMMEAVGCECLRLRSLGMSVPSLARLKTSVLLGVTSFTVLTIRICVLTFSVLLQFFRKMYLPPFMQIILECWNFK